MTRIVAEKMAAEDVSGTGRLAAFVRYGLRLLMTTVGILLIGFGLLSVVLIPLVNDASYADSAKYIGSTFIVLGVLILWRSRSAPKSVSTKRTRPAMAQRQSHPSHPSQSDVNGRGRVECFWLETTVKLGRPIRTPMGSRVSVLTVCVDIDYAIRSGVVKVERVSLARGGLLSGISINVASTNGEAFLLSSISPAASLINAAESDIAMPDSSLRRIMFGKVLNP